MKFIDPGGNEIAEREEITQDSLSYKVLLELFVKYPLDMCSVYIRHLIALLTPKFSEAYIPDLYVAKGLRVATAIFIWLLAGTNLLIRINGKDAIFTIIYGLCFAILPFFWLNGGVFNNIRLLRELMEEYAELIRPRGFGLSSPTILMMKGDFGILPYAMAILSLISAPMLKAEWKKLMLLTMVVNMTSGEQSFYCMIFLFLPIVLFFNEEHKWYDIFYVLGFVLILSPIQYSWVGTHIQLYHRAVCNTICILIYAALLSESTACPVKKIFVQKIRGAL